MHRMQASALHVHTYCSCGMMPILSGVRMEAGDMGLAEEGYMDEDMEEGPGEGVGTPGMEGEGRMCDGGAEGGGISALAGGFEVGVCSCKDLPRGSTTWHKVYTTYVHPVSSGCHGFWYW